MAEKGTFAERLRSLREKAGLSQAVLADRAGIGVSTIRQFEYGRREPTFGTLTKLAKGLGVSLAAFDVEEESPAAPETGQSGGVEQAEATEAAEKPKKVPGRKPKGK